MLSERNEAYQFKVILLGIEPPIWRRIQVPGSYSFWDLHVAIQDSMGWLDRHLHLFRMRDPETGEVVEIGIPDDEGFADERPCLPGWKVPLSAYVREPGTRAVYLYDFGDNWEHEVVLEDIIARVPRQKYPKCVAGARACPPEDCGGVGGYEDVLRVLQDPTDEEYENTMQWLGGRYDPEAFDPNRVRFDNPKKRLEIAFGGR